MGTTLEDFEDWRLRNSSHLDRHIGIIQRHGELFKEYIKLIQRFPIDSQEAYDGILVLHRRIGELAIEMKEVTDGFAADCGEFVEILNKLRAEIASAMEAVKKDEK